MNKIKPGIYEHYKGKRYEVIGEAVHSETREEVVVYKMLYETKDYPFGSLWVRPKKMFLENILIDGKEMSRFKWLANE